MGWGTKILLGFLGIFGIYIFFRVASFAIAKSWMQVFYLCEGCMYGNKNKKGGKDEKIKKRIIDKRQKKEKIAE